VNVQIPWEFRGVNAAQMKVSLGPGPLDSSALYNVPLAEYSPGIIEFDDAASGRRIAAAHDEAFQVVTGANPAVRGRAIQIYCNGLGPVTNAPASGAPSPAEPLAETRVLPTVTIGGVPAEVLFSGLTPHSVGLYQVNVVVPSNAPAGIQPIVLTINGITAKTASLVVN
jgi:uncharacterized protein (TIGR03437 family)